MMSGQEIADTLGITRQAVSGTLKRAMGKAFINAKELWPDIDAFEVATNLSVMFNIGEDDMSKFYKLFPKEIRIEIENAAKKRIRPLKPLVKV